MKGLTSKQHIILLLVTGIVFFIPFLGYVHLFDWDEINFAESSREMLATGNYFQVQVNYEPFWEKPPLFMWLQVICMKTFGVNEFAARFPNALFGILTLITLFIIGKKLHSKTFGWIWSMTYFGAFLPFLYYKSGIIDPVFNFFIFFSIYFLIKNINETIPKKKLWFAFLAGGVNGLAIITKGPVGLLFLLLTFLAYVFIKKFKVKVRFNDILIFALGTILTTFSWYGYETITNSPWFLVEFIKYQIELFSEPVAGHEQPFYYHFVVVLFGCFPMSILAIGAFQKNQSSDNLDFRLWMKCLFWVVLILFSIVKTKIVHYSSMTYLPLSYLAAYYIYYLYKSKAIPKKWIFTTLYVIAILFGLILTLLPIAAINKEKIFPYIKDPFAVASFNQDVYWSGLEFLIGVVFIAITVYGIYMLSRGNILKYVSFMGYGVAISLFLYLVVVVPKIENYSQRPAIEFYKELQGKNVYVTTLGFKSYAHYFYFNMPQNDSNSGLSKKIHEFKTSLKNNEKVRLTELTSVINDWLLKGNIDKDAYFVTKTTWHTPDDLMGYLTLIKTKGGFNFYKRKQ